MTDTTLVVKVTVIGSILAAVLGQNYFIPSFQSTPRGGRPVFLQQPVVPARQPGVFFVRTNQYGALSRPYNRAVYGANRYGVQTSPYNSGAYRGGNPPATRTFGSIPIQVGPGIQGSTAAGARHQLNAGANTGANTAETLINAGTIGGTPLRIGPGILGITTPTPVVTTTQSNLGPNEQTASLATGRLGRFQLKIAPGILGPASTTPVPEKSRTQKMAEILARAVIRNHEIRMQTSTTTPSPIDFSGGITGDPRGTHTHSFLQRQNANSGNNQIFVHSHGQNQQPHVHIAHDNIVPTTHRGVLPRRNTHQTIVPDVLSAAPGASSSQSNRLYRNQLPAPTVPQDAYSTLPHFLTGGNKKTVVTRKVNTTLLKPTRIPTLPVRRQIPPPSRPTIPTQPNTNPTEQVFEEAEEEEEEEVEVQEPSVQHQSITQLTPPNSQIPAPLPIAPRQPTTSQEPRGTSVSTTSASHIPTTLPAPSRAPGQL